MITKNKQKKMTHPQRTHFWPPQPEEACLRCPIYLKLFRGHEFMPPAHLYLLVIKHISISQHSAGYPALVTHWEHNVKWPEKHNRLKRKYSSTTPCTWMLWSWCKSDTHRLAGGVRLAGTPLCTTSVFSQPGVSTLETSWSKRPKLFPTIHKVNVN